MKSEQMATSFCMMLLTLHKSVLYASHRGMLCLHEIKPTSKWVFLIKSIPFIFVSVKLNHE